MKNTSQSDPRERKRNRRKNVEEEQQWGLCVCVLMVFSLFPLIRSWNWLTCMASSELRAFALWSLPFMIEPSVRISFFSFFSFPNRYLFFFFDKKISNLNFHFLRHLEVGTDLSFFFQVIKSILGSLTCLLRDQTSNFQSSGSFSFLRNFLSVSFFSLHFRILTSPLFFLFPWFLFFSSFFLFPSNSISQEGFLVQHLGGDKMHGG